MEKLEELYQQTAARHYHLCPRQVLGVRMGLLAGQKLGLEFPQKGKRAFCFCECDGCGMDGIATGSGCQVERRTMRIMDYGKLSATFVDTKTGRAVRVAPKRDIRNKFSLLGLDDEQRWQAMLDGYKVMSDEEMFDWRYVTLTVDLAAIISRPGLRVTCEICGEEVTNEREVRLDGRTLCKSCAGDTYFQFMA
jgi:formylmethanofuran dehydrogenase subunit E